MAAQSTRKGLFGLWRSKPSKPTTRGSAVAFKAGKRSFKKSGGSSPDLQRVVLMSLENELRAKA